MTKPLVFFCLCCWLLLAACHTSKKAIYFNNTSDSSFTSMNGDNEPIIQKNDLLSITVSSANPDATVIFNIPNLPAVASATSVNNAAVASPAQVTGYLVSAGGSIKFPVLGEIPAAGLSKKQLIDTLTGMLVSSKQLVDPIVNVRLINFKVTVLGEVARPTVITVVNEKISILEALGMAGDLTLFAKRDEIMLIREDGPRKIVKRINLNAAETLSSPYYYLRSNDVIYAEPNGTKINTTSGAKLFLPFIVSAISFSALLITRVLK